MKIFPFVTLPALPKLKKITIIEMEKWHLKLTFLITSQTKVIKDILIIAKLSGQKILKGKRMTYIRPSIHLCITKYLLFYLKGKALQIQSDENSFLSTTSAVLKSDLKKNSIW